MGSCDSPAEGDSSVAGGGCLDAHAGSPPRRYFTSALPHTPPLFFRPPLTRVRFLPSESYFWCLVVIAFLFKSNKLIQVEKYMWDLNYNQKTMPNNTVVLYLKGVSIRGMMEPPNWKPLLCCFISYRPFRFLTRVLEEYLIAGGWSEENHFDFCFPDQRVHTSR